MTEYAVSIAYMTKGRLPRLPFVDIKNKILGKNYDLSIVCVSKNKAISLNKEYRQKEYTPNILSFSLSKKSGEIVLHLPTLKKQYKLFKMSYNDYVTYILIHGCLHLKGLEHGSKMEKQEDVYKKYFNVKEL